MHKRRFLLAASAAAVCGASAAQARTTLRFLWWGGSDRHQRTLKAITAFETKNPSIRVKAEYMGFNGYLEKLTTQMVGGIEPDVMQINWAWLAMFSRHGTGFMDLAPFANDLSLSGYGADEIETCRVQGKLNGLPLSFSARIFLWNVAALTRAGLPKPKSWEELFASGATVRQKLGERGYLLDGELQDMFLLAQTLTQQKHGKGFIDAATTTIAMNDAALLDWVNNFRKLYGPGLATPIPYRASLGGLEKPLEQQADWVVGRWLGTYTWDSVIRLRNSTLDKDQKLGVGDFLTLPDAKNSGMFGRPSLLFSVSRHCKEQRAAVEFLKFITSDPSAVSILGTTRGIPSLKSSRVTLADASVLPPLEMQAQAQITERRNSQQFSLPSMRLEDARMRRFLREVFERVAYGRLTAEQAAHELRSGGEALLKRMK